MTDTMSPITGPLLTPMFATGSHPKVSNTAPHPAPIFDTGPHPVPLQSAGESVEADPAAEDQPSPPEGELPEAEAPEPQPESEAESPGFDDPAPLSQAFSELENDDTDAFLRTVNGHAAPVSVPAQPVLVPSSFLFVKRWQFAAITAGVWALAAAAGLGFYFWWYTSLDKTLPVFAILLYIAVCAVAAILVTMVPDRPHVAALAIALMGAPMASVAAAAVLHGAYYFEWIARPVIGPVIG